MEKSANKSTSQPWCSHSRTIYDLQLQKTIILRMQLRHHATFMQPFQCDLQTQSQETHRTTYTGTSSVTKHIEGTKRPQPHPPHRRGTFHRRLQPLYTEKRQGFVLRLPPHNKAHATFMQPFQCDLQTQTQETQRTTYAGTSSVAKHIEGTKRPQPHPPHRRGTFHRRLQPLYTEKHKVSCSGFLPTTKPMQHSCSHSNAICKHKLKKLIETTYTGTSSVAKHIEGTKRPQPHPPHRRGTFHRRLQPLYTEKHKVSCSGFLPTTKPMQHSCSHSNAICKHKVKKRIELRTQEHPVLQNTLKERNDPSRTRRTDEVPFIVACSHFTRKNTRFRAPSSSPEQSPCNIHAAIPMRSANTNSRNA